MNNALSFENDLSSLNEDFSQIHSRYNNKVSALRNAGMMSRASDLAKQSSDLIQKGQKVAEAVEGAVGSVGAKHLVGQVIKPAAQSLGRGVAALRSRFSGGGADSAGTDAVTGEGDAGEVAEGFTEIRPGLYRANAVARPSSQMPEQEGTEMQEGTNVGAEEGLDEGLTDAAVDAAAETGAEAVAGGAAALGAGTAAAGTAAGEAVAAGAGAAATAGEAAAGAVASTAAAVAGSNWWNIVGWGSALVAGGAGIAAAIEAGEKSKSAKEAGEQASRDIQQNIPTQASLAGKYISPVMNNYQG
jgi:hypothetical protein